MNSQTKAQLRTYSFALMFRQFMLVNNRHTFSSIEILEVGKQISRILGFTQQYNSQYILKLLSKYGVNNVLNKYSHSTRHRLWFNTPLDPKTLKVKINA